MAEKEAVAYLLLVLLDDEKNWNFICFFILLPFRILNQNLKNSFVQK